MKRILLVLTLFLFFFVPSYAYAIDYCPGGQFNPLCSLSGNDYSTLPRNVFNIMLVAAVLLSLGFLIYGGIKWITSNGDKSKVDSARSTLIGAIVGLVVAFSAFMIVSLVSFFFGLGGGTIIVLPTLNSAPAGGGGTMQSCASMCSGMSGGTGEEACINSNRAAGRCI